jgi:hypothetical protein
MSSHEPLHSHRAVLGGSNRNFGLVFSGVFALLGLWPLFRHAEAPRWWMLAISAAFALIAFLAPGRLAPLNRWWFKFGLALHSVVSPLIMGLLYYGAVTPMGLSLRAAGKDLLRLKRDDARSYWIKREPRGPAAGSMKNQF